MRTFLLAAILGAMACGGGGGGEPDLSSSPDLGPGQFGDKCTANPLQTQGSCDTGLICDMFAMNTVDRCTRMCDNTTTPTNCPAPSVGTCNAKGECKFTQ
jgi:hypothetical protein